MSLPARKASLTFLLLLFPSTISGAGFLIYEAGGKALGMGGAFAAQADDPSAIFFNPAGIVQLDGTHVYVGGTLIITGTDFAGADPEPGYGVLDETETQLFSPINAYVTYKIRPAVAAGIGIFNPYGLGRDWKNPESYSGRHIADEVDLKTFYINPTLAWQPSESTSLGVGVQLVYSTVALHRFIEQWDPNGSGFLNVGTLDLEGNNTLDAGFNLGILLRPREEISIGLTFRSDVTVDYEGDADFTQIPSGNSALDSAVTLSFPEDQGAKTKIHFPWLAVLGAAYRGVERWVFEVDLIFAGWSEFKDLPFEFEKDPGLNTARKQDFENKLSVRTGAAFDCSNELKLRGGYYFDPSPQPRKGLSPILSDTDRHGITFGVGYSVGPWAVDLFDLIVIFDERGTGGENLDGYEGRYSSFANLVGLNFGYSF